MVADLDELLRELARKETLMPGEAARALGVKTISVDRWIDSGKLVGWKLPGSGQRRVLAASVIAVLKAGLKVCVANSS